MSVPHTLHLLNNKHDLPILLTSPLCALDKVRILGRVVVKFTAGFLYNIPDHVAYGEVAVIEEIELECTVDAREKLCLDCIPRLARGKVKDGWCLWQGCLARLRLGA